MWVCTAIPRYSRDLFLSSSDRSGPGLKCVRVDDVVTTARLIYYGGKLLQMLEKSIPIEAVP